jgi:hypothetical protein
MTKPKTLREWMSDQQAPAHIQNRIQELFELVDRITPYQLIEKDGGYYSEVIRDCARRLHTSLDTIPEENT